MSTLTVTLPEGTSVVDKKQLTFIASCDAALDTKLNLTSGKDNNGQTVIYDVFERGVS